MSNISLPRGAGNTSDVPLATADWATPQEVSRYQYRYGDIWLGSLPCPAPEAWPELENLQRELNQLPTRRNYTPQQIQVEYERISKRINALNETDSMDIGIDDDRHQISIAGTRSGKGTTIIRENLRRYPGSILSTDPKGENARQTAELRMRDRASGGLGQKVYVLDPYRVSGLKESQLASWNPLDLIDNDDEQAIDRASSIAEALIVRSNPRDGFFDDNARSVIKALILYVALKHAGRPTRNLVTVYDLLTRGAYDQMLLDKGQPPGPDDPTPFDYLLQMMTEELAFNGVISAAAHLLLNTMSLKERGSVLSTTRRNLEFLERTPIRRVLSFSSFNLDELKTDQNGVSVYLCLPPQRMHDCGRWLRLMITSALERLYEIDQDPATGHRILFLLEEFASLGYMEAIEHAAGYAAGFGLKLWVILQDFSQLKEEYKKGWETFVGNAGVIQAFANSDLTTLEYLSKKLGEIQIVQTVKNVTSATSSSSNDPGAHQRLQALMQNRGQASLITNPLSLLVDPASSGHSASTTESWNRQIKRTPLLLPNEIEQAFAREHVNQILLIKGQKPIALGRTT